jgi:hypothetical protein
VPLTAIVVLAAMMLCIKSRGVRETDQIHKRVAI